MGSGRGDRNQVAELMRYCGYGDIASMGSGRGDRNQVRLIAKAEHDATLLQWGPVVVTGIRAHG